MTICSIPSEVAAGGIVTKCCNPLALRPEPCHTMDMKNKNTFQIAAALGLAGLIAAAVAAGPEATGGSRDWAAKVAAPVAASVATPAPAPKAAPEVADQLEFSRKYEGMEGVARRMVDRCDRDWLPTTCAKMRAELTAEYGYKF